MTDAVTANPNLATASTNSVAAADQASLADDFESFLTLLTAQLQNQDPLSPLDSTEFVSQLVEFSSVEQQIKQNDNLETLITVQTAGAAASGVAFIGRNAAIAGDEAELRNGQATWSYELPQAVRRTDIIISDAEGKVVFKDEGALTVGGHRYVWDGRSSSGAALPDGLYTAQITARGPEDDVITAQTAGVMTVTGVDLSAAEPNVIAGGSPRPFANIVELSDPQTL